VLHILRLGAYQILFCERIPQHAAVDESAALAHATGRARAAGFVNAVLREITRDVFFLPQPDGERPRHSFALRPDRACCFGRPILPPVREFAAHLAMAKSYPEWLLRRWLTRYGTERTDELTEIGNTPPPLFVRPNGLRNLPGVLMERLEAEGVSSALSPSGRTVRLPAHTQVRALAAFREGLFQVQDDSSAAVARFLKPRPGDHVLDLCAAPGGKTCHLAEIMRNEGQILAVDLSGKRLARVSENAQRLGIGIVATVEGDGVEVARQHPAAFDRVLIDAPCTNSGVLRRRVEARWRLSPESLAALLATQRRLLDAGLDALKPSGALVYSTCSLAPEENGEMVRATLRSHAGFRLDAEESILPSLEGGDGLYMARILRAAGVIEDEEENPPSSRRAGLRRAGEGNDADDHDDEGEDEGEGENGI